jgi:hypothetical protein
MTTERVPGEQAGPDLGSRGGGAGLAGRSGGGPLRLARASAAEQQESNRALLPKLDEADYLAVRFVLDLVDRLGREHGFDPAQLVSLRTGEALGPLIGRLRCAAQLFEVSARQVPTI